MAIITCIVAAAAILAVLLLLYLANGARSRDGDGNPSRTQNVKQGSEHRATGVN
jgi:hypothetical protein